MPDKFRGTARAAEAAAAIVRAAAAAGWDAEAVPVADGGEGLLDCFGGPNRYAEVTGPLGARVTAGWRLDGSRAVVEMAAASGLALTHGRNDPMGASTAGTGELIAAAIDAGATLVIVGAGGSATTDGGLGAVDVLRRHAPLAGVIVAADVTTPFLDAAEVYAPQKGADAGQVAALSERLHVLAERYRGELGVDVTGLPSAGAAGGLAGGLAALGASIESGFRLVADELDLRARIAAAGLVVTGEGRFDATSVQGKAAGGVLELAAEAGTPALLVVGELAGGVRAPVPAVSLVERFGRDAALHQTVTCIETAVGELLSRAGQNGRG
jgi:glycerate kinase